MTRRAANGWIVPDQNLWTGEVLEDRPVFAWEEGGLRLTYADPRPDDVENGVVWLRHGQDHSGDECWRAVNTPRTRVMMREHRCMVCTGPCTDPETGRIWWLFAEPPATLPDGTPVTNLPPTCPACIPEALATCPRMRGRRHRLQLVTVAATRPYGVTADLYEPGDGDPPAAVKAVHEALIPYAPEAGYFLRFALGKQPWLALEDMRDGVLTEPVLAPRPRR